jgi:group II intron reverse transcriptase/maturase
MHRNGEGEAGHNVQLEGTMEDTLRSQTISTQLQKIAHKAASNPELVFTTLVHLMDVEFLKESFHQVRIGGAVGVDKVSWMQYASNLDENLKSLYERLRNGTYRAQAVRRSWIDKDDGKKRPLGILVIDDKVVQRAAKTLLEAVYEQDFYEFSHGFRPDHSPHQALKELREKCIRNNVSVILDADVTGYFDNINRRLLKEIIKKRVNDGGLLRLIGKWLNAGVLDGEDLFYPETGTPQGGVISPILANIFLHIVLDEWYVKEIKPLLKGKTFLIRFADDFVFGFELESDARRVMNVLVKRFAKYGLTIHPEKTALIDFRNPSKRNDESEIKKDTFDFLGFTHYWGKSRRGYYVIKRKTIGKRLRQRMKLIWHWCKENLHVKITEQVKTLRAKLYGHYQYYGIRGNYKMLEVYYEYLLYAWRRWLGRRTRNGYINNEKFDRILETFKLPKPRIVQTNI